MKNILGLVLLLVAASFVPLYAEQKPQVTLVPEHVSQDWEAVSLDLLVKGVEAQAAKEGLKNFKVQVNGRAIQIVYRDILFPADSPQITDDTDAKVRTLAKVIQRFSDKNMLVEGHSAKVPGQKDDGTVLSQNRAQAVADVLASTGLFVKERLQAVGHGDTIPVADNATEEGRALNRRVEISISEEVKKDTTAATGSTSATPIPAGLTSTTVQPAPSDTSAHIDTATPKGSVWWKTLSDNEKPGYTIFLVDKTRESRDDVLAILAKNGFSDLKVYDTQVGTVVIYDKAEFATGSNTLSQNSVNDLNRLSVILSVDINIQTRTGGYDGTTKDGAEARQVAVGATIASSGSVRPDNTLVGDEPTSFSSVSGGTSQGQFITSVDTVLAASLPLARYAEFSQVGLGLGVAVNFKIPGVSPANGWSQFRIRLSADGYYHIPNATSSVTALYEIDWALAIGYRFELANWLHLTPRLGYGGTEHILSATREGIGVANGTIFYNQAASFETEFEFGFQGWALLITPAYRIFFDDGYFGHSLSAKIGIRFEFQ